MSNKSQIVVFIGINGHANAVSLPLRLGVRISEKHQQFAVLEDAEYDDIGTRGQRPDEFDKGNRHYIGELSVRNENPAKNEPYKLKCRVVLGSPQNSTQNPPVVTILRLDGNKGDMTVTRHLEGMLKRGKITVEDLRNVFHPAYLRGEILSSNDCDDAYEKYIRSSAKVDSSNTAESIAIMKNPQPVVDVINNVGVEDVSLKSPLTYEKLPIANVRYEYVMADAYIENVRIEDDRIKFSMINSKGVLQEVHSFKLSSRPHLSSQHKYALDYLKGRDQQRAMFAICNSGECRGFIAESVTAISLQLMRAGFDKG